MKVLFDITALGTGYKYANSRAGVGRVVEDLALQLVLENNCDLKFCGSIGIEEVESSIQYFHHSAFFAPLAFSKPLLFNWRIKIHNNKKEVISKIINRSERTLVEKLATRLVLRASDIGEEFLKNIVGGYVNPNDVSQTDIYHSPFYAIPKQIRNAKKKKVFLTSHDIIALLYPQFFVPSIIRTVKEIVESITPDTWVLCVSEATRNDLLNYMGNKINPHRTIVTHLASSDLFFIDNAKTKDLEIRKKYNIPEGPYILSLCTLEPRKNLDKAIKAYSRLIQQQHINDVSLVLVGAKGWLSDNIFKEIELSSEVKKRIIVTGFVADKDLSAIYSNALFFIYPSLYEGFGLPPLEAMKCGIPVITSNTSSLPEVVGKAGVLVDPTNLDSICQAMFSIYINPSFRSQLVSESIEQANRFSWEKCARETVEAYNKSLL